MSMPWEAHGQAILSVHACKAPIHEACSDGMATKPIPRGSWRIGFPADVALPRFAYDGFSSRSGAVPGSFHEPPIGCEPTM